MPMQIYPNVYVTIQDNSFYINPLPGTIGFIPFVSEKGPDNKLMLSEGPNFLLKKFGFPNKAKYGEGLYVAHAFNQYSADLYIMRVLPNDASYANLEIQYDHATTTLSITSATDLYSDSDIDTSIAATNTLAIFYPIGRGQYYNNLAINLTPSVNVSGAYDLDIYDISSMGTQQLVETFVVSFDDQAVDSQGESLYITRVLERYSDLLRCVVNDATYDQMIADGVTDVSTVFSSITNLAGGTDGSLYDASGNLDYTVYGNLLVNAYNGTIDPRVVDTEFTYFNLVFDAGYPQDVKDAIASLVVLRGDAIAIMDLGDNSNAANALNVRTMMYNYNTMYVALYEMYSKIYDSFNGYDIWITPVYHMAQIIPKVDRDYNSFWEPPAGLKKAMVTVKDTRYDVMGAYKNQFILSQINHIAHFLQGYCIWGEYTSQQEASSLQEIHVARLVLWIKRVIKERLRSFIWDLNTDATRESIKRVVTEFMNSLVPSPLEYANVNVYATEYDKKLGIARVQIQIKPVGVLKIIDVLIMVQ